MSWQLQTIEALASTPEVDLAKAEGGALEISRFVAQAPTDFLEPLLSSPFGRVYKLFLDRCCTEKFIGSEAATRRDTLSQQLRQIGCDSPEGWAVLLALFPLFPPEQLKVDDALSKLPKWLHEIYAARYEASELAPSTESPTGQSACEDRIFLNRMLGLSNHYYLDPEDGDI